MKYISFLFFLCFIHSVTAQTIDVRGRVTDAAGNALPYAIIELRTMPDSTLYDGTSTDEMGTFIISVPDQNYFVNINMLGLETKSFQVSKGSGAVDLGRISLAETSIMLDGITIQGQKSTFELKLDKRVFNVGQDLTNSGANATEVLENIPSISIDGEGNVSLRGSQNVRILVNGKPSGLVKDGESLQNLQGNMIESVEVVTNASARYEAEGDVGIINIILKKNQRTGFNGSVNANIGYNPQAGIGVNLNYRTNRINYFANYSINHRTAPAISNTYQRYIGADTSFTYRQYFDQERRKLSNNAMVGADFDINEHNSLTASFLFDYGYGNHHIDRQYDNFNGDDQLLFSSIRLEDQKEIEYTYEATLDYIKTFDQPGKQLSVRTNWNVEDETESSDYRENITISSGPGQIERSNVITSESNWMIQTDFVQPLWEAGKFETGLRTAGRTITNDFVYGQLLDNNWSYPEQFNDEFKYTENITAGYVILANQFNRFSAQGGLRAEYTDIRTRSKNESLNTSNRKLMDWFPSASLSYAFENKNTVQLSYSKRIRRPGQWDLLPFTKFGDNREMRNGNVNLNPEYTDSYEVGFLQSWTNGTLLSSIYHRHKTGVIERLAFIDDNGIIRMTPQNLSTENSYGVEMNLNYEFFKWMRLNTGFNFFRAVTEGEYEGVSLDAETYTWTNRTALNVNLDKWRFQSSFNYRAPRTMTQSRHLAMYHVDLGISREILNGKGNLVFNVRDVFNTRKWRSIRNTGEIYSETDMQWRPRSFNLSVTYRINQKQDPKKDVFRENGDMGGDMNE